MVVDDSMPVRRGLVAMINSDPGMVVCGEASNGRECISQVTHLKPDAVVLDISMPVMNGLEAARFLRVSSPTIPVIICSSFEGPSLRREAENVGAKGIVSKSQPLEELLACIKSALGLSFA